MNVLISVDIEGIAGVFHPEQTRPGNGEYERARRQMTEEANAVIRGALAGGAQEIVVNDSHGSFRNLLPDLLHPAARMVLGKPRVLGMMGGVADNIDAVMMVGYHSRSQTRGILAHTINSFAFSRVWFNGVELGEAGIYGALAGEHGVPVIFGSGDDAFVAETLPLFPHAHFAEIKKAHGANSGDSLSPQQACALLEKTAQEAVQAARSKQMPKYRIEVPVTCRLQVQTPALTDLFCQLPIVERVDAVTLKFDAPTVEFAVRVLNSLSAMSFMLR
ncbi:D-aminopeptidase [Herbaspirillum sp. CF444]|uniref:M55 family metallopeptidase n=1 Tax=Herbaspirillum sp. CF444 TaxID=1144319 RepID=UPI000272400F|nr:M55 family metallopeptidase [Herbaspirillum sp. CF444]EJL88277.1 D-aminopeptidase [Herbaspirillum sp. CF444]